MAAPILKKPVGIKLKSYLYLTGLAPIDRVVVFQGANINSVPTWGEAQGKDWPSGAGYVHVGGHAYPIVARTTTTLRVGVFANRKFLISDQGQMKLVLYYWSGSWRKQVLNATSICHKPYCDPFGVLPKKVPSKTFHKPGVTPKAAAIQRRFRGRFLPSHLLR